MAADIDNAVKVAVLATEINGLREQQKSHAETMFKKLDDHANAAERATNAIMNRIDPIAEWIQQNHEIPGRITVLWDERNNTKGFFKASSILGGALSGGLIMLAEKLFR